MRSAKLPWVVPVRMLLALLLVTAQACTPAPVDEGPTALLYFPGQRHVLDVPLSLRSGPHLFLDDELIESSENIFRRVNRPVRDPAFTNPIVTGKEDGCFQPYMTILRDLNTGQFRIWYQHRTIDFNPSASHLGYMESVDGIRWIRPQRVLDDPAPIQFGASILDHGPGVADPKHRYKYAWYSNGGLKVATSPDGLTWVPMMPDAVLLHNHDINSIFWDPLRQRYVATVSIYTKGVGWSGDRRTTWQAHSPDLLTWSKLHAVLLPVDQLESGETQFYAMDGFLARGGVVIGMVKVLHDDWKADNPPDPPEQYGVGYTALAWTRDGKTWVRDREPFFDRAPERGAWDHAHAWIDEQLPMGDDVYLYYGGYARGHKVNRFEERQIGLVKMKRDRYVGRAAGRIRGTFRTPPVVLYGGALTLNAKVDGELHVRVLNEAGTPLEGYDWDDGNTIQGDSLVHTVAWKNSLLRLEGLPVRLEFALREAELFAFTLEAFAN